MKQLIHFNLIWGIIFSIFFTTLLIVFRTDGKWNTPLSIEQYTSRCGKPFDYYAGYWFLTSNDSRNRNSDTKFEFNLVKKTYVRYLCLFLYPCLWFLGFLTPARIRKFFSDFLMESNDVVQEVKETVITYRFEDYFCIIITTWISLYGIYYSGVYMSTYWHN